MYFKYTEAFKLHVPASCALSGRFATHPVCFMAQLPAIVYQPSYPLLHMSPGPMFSTALPNVRETQEGLAMCAEVPDIVPNGIVPTTSHHWGQVPPEPRPYQWVLDLPAVRYMSYYIEWQEALGTFHIRSSFHIASFNFLSDLPPVRIQQYVRSGRNPPMTWQS